MENIKRFTVIEGGQSPREDTHIRPGEERVTCHVCLHHEGVDTVEFLPIHTMVVRKGNEMKPVLTRMACLNCFLKGRKTYLT